MQNNINITGKITSVLSFVIGTMLLSFYLYFKGEIVSMEMGIGFIVMAVMVNLIVFSVVLGSTILNKEHRTEGLKTCGLMLLNIPIAIGYFLLILHMESIL